MTITNTSRRALLAGAAAIPLAVAVQAPACARSAPDPIFAMIEAHRMAYRRLEGAYRASDILEEQISPERRKRYSIFDRDNAEMIASDDPRWTAALDAVNAASDVEEELALALVNTQPTTVAGVAALMRYGSEHEAAGAQWDSYISEGRASSWEQLAMLNAAEALDRISGDQVAKLAS